MMKKAKTIYELSSKYFAELETSKEKDGKVPDNWGGIATLACNAIDDTQKELDKLRHYEDVTEGLFAIDFDPKELLAKFINSQSDACSLVCEDAEQLQEDWVKWINNENHLKSPFDQIKRA